MKSENFLKSGVEGRQFFRLDACYPVEFTIDHIQGGLPGIGWESAYLKNVCTDGLCLETPYVDERTMIYLEKNNVFLKLRINVPVNLPPIKCMGEVRWVQKIEKNEGQDTRFVMGIKYKVLASKDLKRIMDHVKSIKRMKVYVVIAALWILFFAGSLVWNFVKNNYSFM